MQIYRVELPRASPASVSGNTFCGCPLVGGSPPEVQVGAVPPQCAAQFLRRRRGGRCRAEGLGRRPARELGDMASPVQTEKATAAELQAVQ